eukprot:133436_1
MNDISPHRIGYLSQTHNQILDGIHSVLTHRYVRKKKDKAVNLLDKLYQHTTERINNTFNKIDQTLKQCKHEEQHIHNFNRILFDHNNQHRRSLQCTLNKLNNYVYHYCIILNDNQFSDGKLIIKCNCNTLFDVFINDIKKATKYNNTMQSINRKYHYITIHSNDVQTTSKLFVSIAIPHKYKHEILQGQHLLVSIQIELIQNLSNHQIITLHHVKQDLNHRILKLRHERNKNKKEKTKNRKISIETNSKILHKNDLKNTLQTNRKITSTLTVKHENEIKSTKYDIIHRSIKMPKLDISLVLQQGKEMKLPLTTSRMRCNNMNNTDLYKDKRKIILLNEYKLNLLQNLNLDNHPQMKQKKSKSKKKK